MADKRDDLGERRDEPDELTSRSEISSSKKPNTGKEYVPMHNGVITMREYQKWVRLFESIIEIDKEYQAGKLVEHWTGLGSV